MSKNTNKQMDFDARHKQMLDAGKKLAKGDDLSKVTAAGIARICGVTAPLVFAHFKDRDVLRAAVREYIKSGRVTGVATAKVAVKVAKPKVKVAVVKAIKNKAAAPKVKVKVAAAKKAAPKAIKKAAPKPAKPKAPAPKKAAPKPAKPKAPAPKKKKPLKVIPVSAKLAVPPAPTVAAE